MEVSREERHTDVAQESSPSQASSYVGRTHVRDMCRWGGFLVAEIQVRVERAGAESQLTPVYSVQGGFLPGGKFLTPLAGWERSSPGNMDMGLGTQDCSHNSSCSRCPPCPVGAAACEERALSGDCIWFLPPGWGPDSPSVACHPSLCDQYSEKGFLHPASSVSCVWGGEGAGAPTSLPVGELISGPASSSPPMRRS